MATYEYDVSEFSSLVVGAKVYCGELDKKINKSTLEGKFGSNRILLRGNKVYVHFNEDLETFEKNQLDSIVGSHKGTKKVEKIYNLVNKSQKKKHFHDINFSRLKSGEKLQPCRIC